MVARLHIAIRGAVQGVGFRPFIYRLANKLKLFGYVLNNSSGVFIDVEGEQQSLIKFLSLVEKDKPTLSVITSLEHSFLDPYGYKDFTIRQSEENKNSSALILPDIALCSDCLEEMLDPNDRRYLYPFINCTNCGPRFSIIESLPYDRPNTSMKSFKMCNECKEEYEDPCNRRFHAQPIACPSCGPYLSLWDDEGHTISVKDSALKETVNVIREGKIIAIKGLGGFQLIVEASNSDAIKRLREKKHRDEKPFALMFSSLKSIKEVCEVSETEERILKAPESPIVLLRKISANKNTAKKISNLVAPKNPYIGAMLPYTPLHHLMMMELNYPVVATSANLSEEPICIDEYDAVERLKGIADYYLVHNRPIVRHADDSIVRTVTNREMVMRRARGYAPLPIQLSKQQNQLNDETILAVGGHLKNTVSLRIKNNVFVSQHIGDLSTEEANKTFRKVIKDFEKLYNVNPDVVLCDMHPDYVSTNFAKSRKDKPQHIQHHYAHAAACRLENQVDGEALSVSWDGTGYGTDGTIWGGEFFLTDDHSFEHVLQFRQFLLPGGEAAIKEPRRSLAGVLFAIRGESFAEDYRDLLKDKFSKTEINIIKNVLMKKINTFKTSSAGRLFDAVSSLLQICQKSSYEGQAAMMLEFSANKNEQSCYPFKIEHNKIDWQPIVKNIIEDLKATISASIISAKFHNTMAKIILTAAKKVTTKKVLLSGGCFQNALLTEKTITLLKENNIKAYWHQRVPPNDGGISFGQVAAYLFDSGNRKKNSVPKKETCFAKEVH